MKKMILFCALAGGMFVSQQAFAQGNPNWSRQGPTATIDAVAGTTGSTQAAVGDDGCAPEDHPCDDDCEECWRLYCHYEPCYYNTYRCIEEPQYYKKKCCRYVPRECVVEKTRYVPVHYKETSTRYEPEYYYVDECKVNKKWVCERQCKYVPNYYYKHVCGDPHCDRPCLRGS